MFKKRNKQATTINTQEIKQVPEQQQPNEVINDSVKNDNSQNIKNGDEIYEGSQPRKKVKIDQVNLIGGSTTERNKQKEQAIHEKFQSLHYSKANKSGEDGQRILTGEEAQKTESELAKQRYLQQVQKTKMIKEGKLSNKIYRGANSYANYKLTPQELQKPQESYKTKYGPTRNKEKVGQNICRFDYDPSLCKDWHDSGYCVFGNSCIYLHDRTTYKTGWQLEKDFQRSQRQRWKRINNPDLEQQPDYLKDIQKFKAQQICPYCEKQLKTPVETSCRHIFCLKCASQMNDKKKKCTVCHKKLDGIMNNAEKTLKKQKQQYEQLLKMTEKNNQISLAKRSKYRENNSLDVFSVTQNQ